MTTKLHYSTVLFDWGDTVMRDDPGRTAPMVEWETVEIIEGIAQVLNYLHTSGRRIGLATSAEVSDENQIRAALARVGVEQYFSKIYCFRNTNLSKGEAFYRFILKDLNLAASEVLMVGDHLEKDVHIPNSLGMSAVWFNPGSDQMHRDVLHSTIHSMKDLRSFFETLDEEKLSQNPV